MTKFVWQAIASCPGDTHRHCRHNALPMTGEFFERLLKRQQLLQTHLCIGLDPDLSRIPEHLRSESDVIFRFNRAIVDATHDLVCCYKPQNAHFTGIGAEGQLEATIRYIQGLDVPVLLDSKRGDVESTSEHYAREAFERYGADAVTVNPYMGHDAMQPFLGYADRGVFILCRTSNPGGADLQHLKLETGETLYQHVARLAADSWNTHGNVGLVVGATRPEELAAVRDVCGNLPFLLPGVGAQGGDIESAVLSAEGGPIIMSASRSVLYASSGIDFDQAARIVAHETRLAINIAMPGLNGKRP